MLQTHAVTHQPICSGQDLFVALVFGKFIPGIAWDKTIFRMKFLSRSCYYGTKWVVHLLDKLIQDPLWPQILQQQPGLPCKLHRPYLFADSTSQETCHKLIEHYQLVATLFPKLLQRQLYSGLPSKLATLYGKNESAIHLTLAPLDRLNKEGELTVQIFNGQQQRLAEASFTLFTQQGKRTLFIGGLQGACAQVEHQAIHSATKDCHGLFPKRLVLETLCQFARVYGIEQILAVNKHHHIYQHPRYQRKKASLFRADYDEFWQSFTQQTTAEGFYQIPLQITRKSLDDIVSKKRAEYRRRYELLDQLHQQVKQNLQP